MMAFVSFICRIWRAADAMAVAVMERQKRYAGDLNVTLHIRNVTGT